MCRSSAFCGRFTLFLHRFLSWWWLHQRLIIFVFRIGSAIWTNKRFVVIIFIKFWWMNWVHRSFICEGKCHMSLRVSGSLTRFWLICETRQIQDCICHSRVFSGRRVQARSRTCNFYLPSDPNQQSFPKLFICGSENEIGTLPVSSTSTRVEHGGFVGKWIMQLSQQGSISELANTKDLLQG